MSLVSSNQFSLSFNELYPVVLSEKFTPSRELGCMFRIANRALLNVPEARLNEESYLAVSPLIFKQIAYYLPQSSLANLAKTSHFFRNFLKERVNLNRMVISNEIQTEHFFKVLNSLKDQEFLPIRSLSLCPEYKMNDEQFLSLMKYLPFLKEAAVCDLTNVDDKYIRSISKSLIKRFDVLLNEEETQNKVVSKLEGVSRNSENREIELYVHGRQSTGKILRMQHKLDDRTVRFYSAFACFTIISVSLIGTFLSRSDSPKEKSILRALLITNAVLCIILPCAQFGLISLKVRLSQRHVNRADYQVIEEV